MSNAANTVTTKSTAAVNGAYQMRFVGLKVGAKRYEVILNLGGTTEVYLLARNEPPKYLANVAPALYRALDREMLAHPGGC